MPPRRTGLSTTEEAAWFDKDPQTEIEAPAGMSRRKRILIVSGASIVAALLMIAALFTGSTPPRAAPLALSTAAAKGPDGVAPAPPDRQDTRPQTAGPTARATPQPPVSAAPAQPASPPALAAAAPAATKKPARAPTAVKKATTSKAAAKARPASKRAPVVPAKKPARKTGR